MFSNKIKPSDFYFERPAQNVFANERESDTLMESSQNEARSGSQKLELSQIANSQDLFVETPGIIEPAEHEIPNSSYDRYMHFKSFQQHAFPAKKRFQKLPSSSELSDPKVETNEEQYKKLELIQSTVTEILEVIKPFKIQMTSLSSELVEQKRNLSEVKNMWNEKWDKASAAFKSAHETVSEIKNLMDATASEIHESKMEFGKFVKEGIPNLKQCLKEYVSENNVLLKQNLDKTNIEVCKLHDLILGETREMHHQLAAEVEKILCSHALNVTKQMEECMKDLQDTTFSTLENVKEIVSKWNCDGNNNRPPYQLSNGNYNGHQYRPSSAHPFINLPPCDMDRCTQILSRPNAAYMPCNRHVNSSFLNKTYHHVNAKEEDENFSDGIHFISKRKHNIRDQIIQHKPGSNYIPRQLVPPFHHKSQPTDANVRATGQEHIYQNGSKRDDSAKDLPFGFQRSKTNGNVVFHSLQSMAPNVNMAKRIKTEPKLPQPEMGAAIINLKAPPERDLNSPAYPNVENTSSHRVLSQNMQPMCSVPNTRKVYMLRSQKREDYQNNITNVSSPNSVSTLKERPIVDDNNCVIIDEMQRKRQIYPVILLDDD